MILIALTLLAPLLGGLLLPLLRFQSRKARAWYVEAVTLVTSALAAVLCFTHPAEELHIIRIMTPFELVLRVDGLSRVFTGLIAFLWPLATLYAFEYMEHEEHQGRFFACYTACYGITAGVALSANMITMYLFVELLTLMTVPLVAHHGDRRSMRAARKYMVYSIGGAALALVGIMILTFRTGRADFLPGGAAGAAGSDGLLTAAWMLTFLGFGVKAAITVLTYPPITRYCPLNPFVQLAAA